MRHSLDRAELGRMARFGAVGMLNAAFGYGVYAVTLWLGFHFTVATAASTVLGVLFNFRSTGRLVFRSHDPRRLPSFLGVYVVIYVCGNVLTAILVAAGVSTYEAGLYLMVPMAGLAYVLQRGLVFKGSV